jgi:demethylspheroidene O-methyltransferase
MASPLPPAGASEGGSWIDRWKAWRDRRVASRAFQRWAASFPLTRPIARRRARELFDLMAGFVYTQVLLSCVRLGLFDRLAEAPLSIDDLAARCGMPPPALQRLVVAAVSLRLLEPRSGGRIGLGPLGAPVAGNEAIQAMVEHHAQLYDDLADPLGLLRAAPGSAGLARYWSYVDPAVGDAAALPPDRVATYSALMSASQPLVTDEVLAVYPLARHQCLLDVGAGEGRFAVAAGAAAPQLQLMLFDLPAVAERAQARLAGAGLADRARTFGGSFFADPLPRGADIVSLVRVVHDHDDAAAMAILRAARQALPDDGTLLLAEPMSATRGAEAMGDAYFGFYLLAMGSGRPRTADELARMLREAGFRHSRLLATHTPMLTRVIVARP